MDFWRGTVYAVIERVARVIVVEARQMVGVSREGARGRILLLVRFVSNAYENKSSGGATLLRETPRSPQLLVWPRSPVLEMEQRLQLALALEEESWRSADLRRCRQASQPFGTKSAPALCPLRHGRSFRHCLLRIRSLYGKPAYT